MDRTSTPPAPHPPPAAPRPLRIDPHGEDGAQAVEYAMIGGFGAGLIGLLWAIISKTSLLDTIVRALLEALMELVKSWF